MGCQQFLGGGICSFKTGSDYVGYGIKKEAWKLSAVHQHLEDEDKPANETEKQLPVERRHRKDFLLSYGFHSG